MSMGLKALLCFVGYFSAASATRIKQRSVPLQKDQLEQLPVERSLKQDKSALVCMKKWQKNRMIATTKFCLVDLQEILDAHKEGLKSKRYTMRFSRHWYPCQAKSKVYSMKLCDLKGTADTRVSYSSRVILPMDCFRTSDFTFKPDGKHVVTVFELAVTAHECTTLATGVRQRRGQFAARPLPAPTPAPQAVHGQVEGYMLHADQYCEAELGESREEPVQGGAGTCGEACTASEECIGFWLHGRTRDDGLFYCRYYRGAWGKPAGPYQGNDCYLKKGPKQVQGYVLHANQHCKAELGESRDELVQGGAEACGAACTASEGCIGFWLHGRTRDDGLLYCRYYRGAWGNPAGRYKGNDCYLKEVSDPPLIRNESSKAIARIHRRASTLVGALVSSEEAKDTVVPKGSLEANDAAIKNVVDFLRNRETKAQLGKLD